MADVEDAEALAKSWGVRVVRAEISKIIDSFEDGLGSEGGRIASANLQARVRMTILYYHANSMGLLVAGTGDRSEEEIGFFTKFGDGGADFLPIAHLFKTQVKALGTYLGIPRKIVEKPPSPQLWTGHTAREELPADYPVIDRVLSAILDQGLSPAKAASATGAPREVVDQILKMRAASDHKRSLPPSLVPKPDVRLIATKD